MTRLVGLLDRYGEAIAADLAFLPGGWDIVELYEQGRWAFALNLIDHLPRTSAYVNAVAQDDDMAELMPEGKGRRQVPLTEWTPEVEVLAAVVDRLTEVVNTIVGTAGGKPSKAQPYPRPVTAIDRARARRHREAAAELEAMLFPNMH